MECILKALILNGLPERKHAERIQQWRQQGGHSYEALKHQIHGVGMTVPLPIHKELVSLEGWGTDMRYLPGIPRGIDVKQFFEAVKSVLDWAQGRLS